MSSSETAGAEPGEAERETSDQFKNYKYIVKCERVEEKYDASELPDEGADEQDGKDNFKLNTKVSFEQSADLNDAKNKEQEKKKETKYDYFGKYLAAQLRSMPAEDAMETQIELQDIIRKRILKISCNRSGGMRPKNM